jgi:hypothetical protein
MKLMLNPKRIRNLITAMEKKGWMVRCDRYIASFMAWITNGSRQVIIMHKQADDFQVFYTDTTKSQFTVDTITTGTLRHCIDGAVPIATRIRLTQ